ncbi:MAG: hypothetical protein D3924_20790, partial [Candidatus Electrothrix sp. AR4]|nr:hypothetical protein [Candidatus Electrothrix sp. AR4]
MSFWRRWRINHDTENKNVDIAEHLTSPKFATISKVTKALGCKAGCCLKIAAKLITPTLGQQRNSPIKVITHRNNEKKTTRH